MVKKKRLRSSFRFLKSLREVLLTKRSSAAVSSARLTVYRPDGDTDHGQVLVVKAKSSDNVFDVNDVSERRSAVDVA